MPGYDSSVGSRRTAREREAPVVDVVDDGLSDAEIAAGFEAWLDELDAEPAVMLPVSAADELRRIYSET